MSHVEELAGTVADADAGAEAVGTAEAVETVKAVESKPSADFPPRADAQHEPLTAPLDRSSGEPLSALLNGRLVPFDAYLATASRGRQQPTHWPWHAVSQAWLGAAHGERGTVALAAGADAGGERVEAAPGISLTVQVVESQRGTRAHRHSFWHLYVVLSGEGSAHIDDTPAFRLVPGDSFYVPPWSAHRLASADEHTPLVLYGLQNLPQLAELGTLVRESPDGELQHVYRAADRDAAG